MLASKIFLFSRKRMTWSLSPERRISSNDSSLLIVHNFLTVMDGITGAFAIIMDPLDALLG
jgi:hypothetical protein